MSRIAWYRVLVVGGAIAVLEALCMAGMIDKITMQAPHIIVRDLYLMLVSGRMNGAIAKTLSNTALRMTLPSAGPHLLTGTKLAVAYAFIGVIGSEFIMSRGGIGYEISFAYANFDNATMYPLIVLILLASVAINGVLSRWEQRLLVRRGMR